MRDDEVIERPVDHRTLTKRYTEEAVRFIDASGNEPFFLYLAHSLPHIPLARSDEFVGHSDGGIYGDVIEEIDWSVGHILDALRSARRRSHDARAVHERQRAVAAVRRRTAARPVRCREGKGTTWEGGVRTPAIFWWPGTIAARRRHGNRARGSTCCATAAALAGAQSAGRSRARQRRPDAGATTGTGPSPRTSSVLLLGQRAAGGAQGPLQGALRHERRLRAGRAADGALIRRCCSICRWIRASGSTSRRSTRTSSPTLVEKPTRIGVRW